SATTIPFRPMLKNLPMNSGTPRNSPNSPNRCGRTCTLTQKPSHATWCYPAISALFATLLAEYGYSAMNKKPVVIAIILAIDTPVCVVESSLIIDFMRHCGIQYKSEREIIIMTPEQTVELINLLARKRAESGLSINEVARRAQVDPGTAWRIEQG